MGYTTKTKKNCKEILNNFSNHIISNGIGVVTLILIYREQIIVLTSLGTNIFSIRKKKSQNQKKQKPHTPKFELKISG